jgi:hypothetical protein
MKKILICALALGWAIPLLAQQKDSSAADKVDVFSNHYYRGSAEKVGEKEKFVVKINPLLFFNGQFPVYLETGIGGSFTAEVAAGFTLKDYVSPEFNFYSFQQIEDYDQDLNVKNTTARPGILLKGALRYYFDVGDFPEGFFVGAQGQFTTHNLDFNIPDMGNLNLTQTGKIPLALSYTDFALFDGYQLEFADHLYFEAYDGIGVRQEHIEFVSVDYLGAPSHYFVKNARDYITPLFLFGVKVGYSF